MDASAALFQAALGIADPWYIQAVRLDQQSKVLEIEIDFRRGSRFTLEGLAGSLPAYDTREIRYRHLNFFQFQCELIVRVPSVRSDDGSLHEVRPLWAGNLRGFTILFEALIVLLVDNGMTFAEASRVTGASPYQIKEIVVGVAERKIAEQDLSEVKRLAIDETSKAKGHDYVTIAADADIRRVVDVQPGRGKDAVVAVAGTLKARGGDPAAITDICVDMSPAYLAGVSEAFTAARVTVDKFHIIQHANQAVDDVRRREQKSTGMLKGVRWILRRAVETLSIKDHDRLIQITADAPTSATVDAWVLKEWLRSILKGRQRNVMRGKLRLWCSIASAQDNALQPMKKVAEMIVEHMEQIVNMAHSKLSNGFLESLHNKFQIAKRKARGFRSFRTIRAMIFLQAGKLDLSSLYNDLLLPT